MVTHKLPTGLTILDERLDGGIHPGSIVVFTAAPTSQSERFLSQLTRPRSTLYLTTQRSGAAVEASLEATGADMTDCRVHEIGPDDPLTHASKLVQTIEEETTLIVDTMTPLEAADDHRLWNFLNEVQSRLVDTESVAVLHCIDGRQVPAGRDTTEYMADVVFDLETETYGDTIENRLFIPKVRRGESLKQAIKLDLTWGVTIDTSRDIA